jgi:UDP-N-acetylglucosamine diphosphorylase / glucose-1-phosphate thymidylyltransferase / UDP-N-acetylgalactosamine diphosphorylase / glucosamine-1-phosphate N-acetyltransferase / galactosamine-1-phosphate N-acetyltransferase
MSEVATQELQGLIPAAGMGTRVRPYSARMPKSMLPINGIPNLQRLVLLMRDQLGIKKIGIITGYYAEIIEEYFGDGQSFGVEISYVRNTALHKGLAWSILLGKQLITCNFCIILSDECYVDSNLCDLRDPMLWGAFATCGIMEVDDVALIKKNYSVALAGSRITRLVEKPVSVENDFLGLGTFICSPEIFPALEQEFAQAPNEYVEFVSFLGRQCKEGKEIKAFPVKASYVNINDRDSLFRAKFHERSVLLARRSTTLLIYSEGHEQRLAFTLRRYLKVPGIEEIALVVPTDNSIGEVAARFGVRVIVCPPNVTLYGEKLKYALDRVATDLVILTEADYAFPSRDIEKVLAYIKEADVVVGTRTTRQLMEQGTDLREVVRLANVFLAKVLEVLWWHFEGRFTDVGCTFRAIWLTSYREMRDSLNSVGPEFLVEMIVEALNRRMRVVEIPLNYRNVSRLMSKKYRNKTTFFRILTLLVTKRLFPYRV